jgi:hypothetical protein
MTNAIPTALLALVVSTQAPIPTTPPCKPTLLKLPVRHLVVAILKASLKAKHEHVSMEDFQKGNVPALNQFERQWYALRANKSPEADEALAWLLNTYLGEHYDEELVCETKNRGPRILAIIEQQQRCLPRCGLEPLPEELQGSGTLAPEVITALRAGTPCEEDY